MINHIHSELVINAYHADLIPTCGIKHLVSKSSHYVLNLNGVVEDINTSIIVKPPFVLRAISEGVTDLAESIRKIGLLQPIVVRTTRVGAFEIVAGNRRYDACREIGWRKITCHIVELDDRAAFEVALTENVQRQSLGPVEEALAFRKYVDEYGWGAVSELAQILSKSPTYVCRRLKLLELPKDVLELLSDSRINTATAAELLSVKSNARQSELAKIIVERQVSSKKARVIIKEQARSEPDYSLTCNQSNLHIDEILKSFDKSIISLKIALNKLGLVIENMEGNWIFCEILMQHKNMLSTQIDLLIKEKKKCKNRRLHSS